MNIKEIGEFGLIDRITKKPVNKDIIVGIGDDAAVINTKGLQVLTTDCLVEGDHFRRDWFSPHQIGMKAMQTNVSDIGAMGARPTYALVSLALPRDVDVGFVEKMYQGMWEVCSHYTMEIIGGNMTHANQIMISITMTGIVDESNLCLRSDAKPGDYIMVSGPVGFGRAGLRLFQENMTGFDHVKQRYLEPVARLDHALQVAPYAHAMIDISDGIGPEVNHICTESVCGAILNKEHIPILDEVKQAAKALGEDPYGYALFGGEDYELIYTVPEEHIDKVNGVIIGKITHDHEVILSSKKKKEKIKKSGYDHFSDTIVD